MNSSMQPLVSTAKTIADILERIIRLMIEEAKWREGTEAQRKLAAWYDKGGGFQLVKVSDAAFEEMRVDLRKRGIPYIPLSQEDGQKIITFRSCDVKEVMKSRDSVLLRRSNYIKQVTGHELIRSMAHGRKEAVFLEGLNKEECAYIRSLCGSMGRGVPFALDKMRDGTFRVGCGEACAVQLEPERMDLGKAALAACLALEGEYRKVIRPSIRADLRFDRESRMGFPSYGGLDKGPLFITGRNEKEQYICLTAKGFEYGTMEKLDDGTTTLSAQISMKSNEPGYKDTLEAIYAKFDAKIVITQEDDLVRHLEANTLDPRADRETGRQEAILNTAEAVDQLIKSNAIFRQTARDDIPSSQKLSEYRNETVRILEGIRTNTVPSGYSHENMEALVSVFKRNGISPESLRDVSARLFEIEPVVRSADRDREPIDVTMDRAKRKSREQGRSERRRRDRHESRDDCEKEGGAR